MIMIVYKNMIVNLLVNKSSLIVFGIKIIFQLIPNKNNKNYLHK